jgi:hypothetical protein
MEFGMADQHTVEPHDRGSKRASERAGHADARGRQEKDESTTFFAFLHI